MDYELRIIVEKVAMSSQEVVKRDTIKTYNIQRPESIIDLGLASMMAKSRPHENLRPAPRFCEAFVHI